MLLHSHNYHEKLCGYKGSGNSPTPFKLVLILSLVSVVSLQTNQSDAGVADAEMDHMTSPSPPTPKEEEAPSISPINEPSPASPNLLTQDSDYELLSGYIEQGFALSSPPVTK